MKLARTALVLILSITLTATVVNAQTEPVREGWIDSTARVVNPAKTQSGAGCLVKYRDVIITNYHVVKGSGGTVEVDFGDKKYSGDVISFDKDWDLALVELETRTGRTAFPLGTAGEEEKVWLARYSVKDDPVPVPTEVLVEEGSIFVLDSQVDYGDSGSCVINEDGQIAGIATFRLTMQGYGNGVGVGTEPIRALWEDATSSPSVPERVSQHDGSSAQGVSAGSGAESYQSSSPEAGGEYEQSAGGGTESRAGSTGAGIGDYELGQRVNTAGMTCSRYEEIPSVRECLTGETISIEQNYTEIEFDVHLAVRDGRIETILLSTASNMSMLDHSLDELGRWSRSFWREFRNSKSNLINEEHYFWTSSKIDTYTSSDNAYSGMGIADSGDGRVQYTILWDGYDIGITVWDKQFQNEISEATESPSASDVLK